MLTRQQILAAVATLGLTGSLAWGQAGRSAGPAAGPGNGRALDNSLQAGAGGYNTAGQQPDYRLGNAVVTGNVPGLGYFHGKVGYTATGEFHGRTGDDPLFRFRAESLGQTPTIQAPGYIPPYSVYKSAAPTLAGDVVRGTAFMTPGMLIRPGAISAFRDPNGELLTAEALQNSMGYFPQANGSIMELSISPLLGVRTKVFDTSGITPRPVAQADMAPRTDTGAPVADSPINSLARIDPLALQPTGAMGTVVPRGYTPQVSATADLGTAMNARIEPERIGDTAGTLDQRVAQLQARMFSPLGTTTVKPGEDVYMDILRREKEQADIAAGIGPTRPPGADNQLVPPPTNDRATPEIKPIFGNDAADKSPLIDAPSKEKMDKAKKDRIRALRVSRGLPPEETPDKAKPGAGSELDPLIDTDKSPVDAAVAKMIRSLRQSSGMVTTLSGTKEDRVNKALKLAEEDIARGNYFNADERYRNVLFLASGHPLARIGQVHAELGAGMIRTAAFNLRDLFDDHPELITMRYDPKLLPEPQRLKGVRNELEEMIASTDRQEPAILLAYLGYQLRQPDLVKYGLDLSQSRALRDPLVLVLRRLWLEPLGKDAGGSGTPTTQGSEATK